ncbi:MAG: rRNA maturation RNase YbeY [Candidatus Tokpelaia sp.]|nr:MAG: rRNA maturation RNase YbeY [Candidatus Tokpelaia sp.]KAA6207480.1 MAG: rRNA maturation RNase YbeY [Candidatus Tokpelaia sp.]
MAKITIDMSIEAGNWGEARPLRRLAEQVVAALFALPYLRGSTGELSLVFTDNAHIRAVNAQWRQQDKATNVLSFPAFPIKAGEKPQIMLGDVILAYETVKAEAELENKPLNNHISHLLLHGCLHLLGYDHETAEEAAIMENLERKILADLAIDDPYAEVL